jgi:hypothetical protein
MSAFRTVFFCVLLTAPLAANADELAPVALNSLSAAPANVTALKVMDQKGQVIGQALRIQADQDGRPSALAFRANNGSTVVVGAAATSYDGKALVTSDDQPQVAALTSVRTAAN